MSKLYFKTSPAGSLGLYHQSNYGVESHVADMPSDLSLDAADQRVIADEWMVRTFPEPLSALAVRRIIHHHRAEQRLADAIEALGTAAAAHG